MDHPGDVPTAAVHRHRDGVDDQVGLAVAGHRPADDQPAENVCDTGQVEPALDGGHVGDVGDPQLVRAGRGELAVDQVRGRLGLGVLLGDRERPLAPVTPDDLGFAHQPGDPLLADPDPGVGELGVDARRAVDLAVVIEGIADLLGQHLIGDGPGRQWPAQPGVEARPADLQQRAQHGHVVERLLPVDEGEPRHLVDSVTKVSSRGHLSPRLS